MTNDVLELRAEGLKGPLAATNSRNSSRPPSTEMIPPKRNRSLRGSSGSKPGGRPEHEGNHLKVTNYPERKLGF